MNNSKTSKKNQKQKVARAVGTVIEKNPIAFIIPYHSVVQSSSGLRDYRWGEKRKAKIIK